MRYSTHHAHPNTEVALDCQLLYNSMHSKFSHCTFVLQFGGSHHCKIGNPTNPPFSFDKLDQSPVPQACLFEPQRRCFSKTLPSLVPWKWHKVQWWKTIPTARVSPRSPGWISGSLVTSLLVHPDVLLLPGNGQNSLQIPIPLYGHPEKDAHPKRQKSSSSNLDRTPKRAESQKKKKLSSADICEAQGFDKHPRKESTNRTNEVCDALVQMLIFLFISGVPYVSGLQASTLNHPQKVKPTKQPPPGGEAIDSSF